MSQESNSGRTPEQEKKFRLIVGWLAFGNSAYDLIEQFVWFSSADLDEYYNNIVEDMKEQDGEPGEPDVHLSNINFFTKIGNELAEQRNSAIYG